MIHNSNKRYENGDGQIRKVPNLKSYEYYVTS